MAGAIFSQPGRGRGARRQVRLVSDINVTPFVDVMLVLLVIFMVTAPLLTAAVEVDLPQTRAAQATGQDEPLVVSIRVDGQLYLGDSQFEMPQLVERLRAIMKNKPEQRVFVRGDKNLAYGKILEVMGDLSAAGFTKVALVSENPGNNRANNPTRPAATPPRPAAPAPAR